MVKTKSQVLSEATGAAYAALNLTVPANIEGLESTKSMAKYIFTKKPEQKISDKIAKSQLDELSTHAQSYLDLTTAENVQRIKEGKKPQ